MLEQRARFSGKAFTCNALSGKSSYNVAINCDLSVSCNCQDYDGSGHLGSLRTESLADVFSGRTASRFREALAAGRLPLLTCARCVELRFSSREEARRSVREYSLPTQGVMVENTVLCNLRCKGCFRQEVSKTRTVTHMSLDDMEIVARNVRDVGIRSIAFFNLGEPFASRNIGRELRLLREYNPGVTISLSTNGVLLESDEKREAALLLDTISFSIDGATQESCEIYQVGTRFERAYANLKALAGLRNSRNLSKPHLIWKYVLFNWNDDPASVRKAISLAREAGADSFHLWPTFRPLQGFSYRFFLDPQLRSLGTRIGRFPPNTYARIDFTERA